MEKKLLFNIKSVSNLTNLNVHTIRAWEKRYSAITPERAASNHRLYSIEDVEKLKLLSEAVNAGNSIGNIANLSLNELKLLSPEKSRQNPGSSKISEDFEVMLSRSIECIKKYDQKGFENLLVENSVNVSRNNLLINFIIPLLERIGLLWANGDIRITHEHFAASILRTFLGSLLDNNVNPDNAPKILTTTPEGFLHELGALIYALYSMDFGWNAIFLGPNLPADEILSAVKSSNVDALLLSLIYPGDEPRTGSQIRKIRKNLDPKFPIIYCGQSAQAYSKFIEETGSFLIYQLSELPQILNQVRINKNK